MEMFVIVDCDALFPPPVYIPCFSSFFPIVKDTLTRRRERESFFCLFALLSTGQIKADGPVLLARAPETKTRNWFDSFFFPYPTRQRTSFKIKANCNRKKQSEIMVSAFIRNRNFNL